MNNEIKNEMRDLIQIIKYYQNKKFKVDEDEVENQLNHLIQKYKLYGDVEKNER